MTERAGWLHTQAECCSDDSWTDSQFKDLGAFTGINFCKEADLVVLDRCNTSIMLKAC